VFMFTFVIDIIVKTMVWFSQNS